MTQGNSGGPPDGRPLTPAAERNKKPIREVLERVLPNQGTVLEVASGTGTHALYFARAMPRLLWQPSEADPESRAAMGTIFHAHAPENLRAPLALDVRQRWEIDYADALVCVNLTHVAPWDATEALLDGAARILAHQGVVVIYGPFRRDGRHTAESNRAFDEALRGRDPEWGLRDIEA
ncbi:MAG: DUF938 domain-containing protein, partial [Halofilum sp. (in: g-proteobacteria)]